MAVHEWETSGTILNRASGTAEGAKIMMAVDPGENGGKLSVCVPRGSAADSIRVALAVRSGCRAIGKIKIGVARYRKT